MLIVAPKIRTIMKKHVLIAISSFIIFGLHACATVPVTGRSQLNIVPQGQLLSMSFSQYDNYLKAHPVSRDQQSTRMVKRVGIRIQKAVEQYFQMNGMADHLRDYHWDFNLVENKEPNAWCMPGGKVMVNTGLLPITGDDTGLAVVMGHEIAHAVANHGNERMSQGIIAQFGQVALSELIKDKPREIQAVYMTAFGLGSNLGIVLPFSRLHENEADRLGLIFMAMAGYNPDQAVDFWTRMAKEGNNKKPPEFLSTHPSDRTRIANIRQHLPEARQYYKPR